MSDLAMNLATNDLLIKNGDMSLVTGVDAIAQDLQQRLQMWLGEWFLDTTKGVPYRQQILVKNPNIDIVQLDLLNAITQTPGIVQVLDFNLNYDAVNRRLAVSTEVQSTNGETFIVQAKINTTTAATIEGTSYP